MRTDGRGYEDFRPIELETDVVPNASGSAHIRLVRFLFLSYLSFVIFLFSHMLNLHPYKIVINHYLLKRCLIDTSNILYLSDQ